jgi:hypothetical protein
MNMADDDKEKIILRCDCHSKHARAINGFDKSIGDNREDHTALWSEIRNRVSNKMFLAFVTLTVGSMITLLGFLWNMNGELKNTMTDIKSQLAVISTKMDYQTKSLLNP